MASASAYHAARQVGPSAQPRPQCLPMQRKILENVLECIVQLKSDFFESREPINDDSITLQRFCAKFEHFLQIGMKEKVSLLGRKKDYWDYFCDCLGSSKGINDGIKYVKSLAENKTSLGRGRAFIRFCLVHQRLADMMQQCVVHDKTLDWFLPGTLMTDSTECNRFIVNLYDLNSLHFDLSPRGYDLDNSWPTFANRKLAGSGSWNVPISRRSSITSMDAISVSMDSTAEVDRLAKNLEVAQSTTSDLVGQIGALQQEKVEVSQSALVTQGELQACQQQLKELQDQHATLQARYQQLDVSHVKLKFEMDHTGKTHSDEIQRLQAKLEEESSRRVSQLAAEEEIWKRERTEESSRSQREVERLTSELEEAVRRASGEQERADNQGRMLGELMALVDIKSENGDFETSYNSLLHTLQASQKQLKEWDQQSQATKVQYEEELKEKGKQVSLLEGRLLEQEKVLHEARESNTSLQTRTATVELELKGEREKNVKLVKNSEELEKRLVDKETEMKSRDGECVGLRGKVSELELRYESLMTERDYLKAGTQKTDALSCEIRSQLNVARLELTSSREEGKVLSAKCEEMSSSLLEQKDRISTLEKSLDFKEHDIEQLRVEGEKELCSLRQVVDDKEQQMVTLREELEEAAKQLKVAFKEASDVGEQNVGLAEKLVKSEGEVDTLKGKMSDMKAELEKWTKDLGERNTQLEDVCAQTDILKDELEEKVKVNESQRSKIADLAMEVKVTSERLSEVTREMEQLKLDADAEKQRTLGLLEESEGVKRSESEKEEKIFSLVAELESLRKDKETAISQLEDRARMLNSQINEKDAVIAELSQQAATKSSEDDDEQAKLVVGLRAKQAESDSKVLELVKQMDSHRLQHENEVASFTERIKHLEMQYSQLETSHSDSCMEYETKIAGLVEERDLLKSSSSEGSDKVTQLTKEVTSLAEDRELLRSKLETSETDHRQATSQLAELTQQLVHLKVDAEKVGEENKSLASQMSAMTDELSRLESCRGDLQREVGEMKDQLRAAEDEAQEKVREKRAAELRLGEVEARLAEAEVTQQSVQTSQFSAQVLEESLVEARKTLEEVRAERSQLQEKYDSLTSEKEKLLEQIDKLEAEKEDFKETAAELSELERLRNQLDEERKKSKQAAELYNEEISALQFQLSAEQMQNTDGQSLSYNESEEKVKADLKERVSDQEIIIERLENELQAAHKVKQLDSSQASKLEKKAQQAEESLKASEKRLAQTNERLGQETTARQRLETELASVRATFCQSLEDKGALIKSLQSDNAQYRKKLVKLIRDKDNLWQKTDRLVTAQKRKSEERWQDNSDVTHCPQCSTEFSLFVRKHHCRLCGRIYCWSCSDFWLDSTLSSKKVRCCKSCFDSHNENESVQSTSMMDHESDDSEDGENEEDRGERSEVTSSSSFSSNKPVDAFSETGSNSQPQSVRPQTSPPASSSYDDTNAASGGGDNEEDIYDDYNNDNDAETRSAGDEEDDSNFQVVSQEDVEREITQYSEANKNSALVPANMTSSMVLSAEELESGKVNQQNEVWVKPGKTFVVPIDIEERDTILHWSFTSQPKDIVFSVTYRQDEATVMEAAEQIVVPCKCDSHKQTVRGELTAKQAGIYSLVFDNTYSRLTSKKVHYWLEYKKNT